MAKYKISVDQSVCIGCAACTAVCPNFRMIPTSDGEKADPIFPEVDDLAENLEAAEVCPTNAIHIEEDGKKII